MAVETQTVGTTRGALKPTLGLTGITINAMALIAPGAFLWTTFQSQSAYGATSMWASVAVASEAIAVVRNAQFVGFCRSVGDEGTARLYAETIQPEESHHQHLGREILEKYCTTPETQELAAAAVRNTFAIADELRNLAAKTTGIFNIPVS